MHVGRGVNTWVADARGRSIVVHDQMNIIYGAIVCSIALLERQIDWYGKNDYESARI
jgi:hypothetical protein